MSIKKCGGSISSEVAGGITRQTATSVRFHEPVLCIEFELSDGRVFGFPYSHLMHYRLEARADSDANSETLTLEFSRHDIVISGRRLGGLRQLLQAGRVASVYPMDSRYENFAPDKPFISAVQLKSAVEADT